MFKWLTVLAMMLAVGLAVVLPIYGQGKSSPAQTDQNKSQESKGPQSSNGPSVSIVSSVKEEAPEKQSNGSGDRPESYLTRLFSPENLPNIGLFFAGVLGIGVAISTLNTIKQQTRVAELNTLALISSERAWIVVSVESHARNQFDFRATNVGKTPAKITVIYSSSTVARLRGESLEPPQEYDQTESLAGSPRRMLPPTASCIIFRCNVEELRGTDSAEVWMNRLAQGFAEVWSHGIITYFDTLEAEPKTAHHTSWRYWHLPFEGSLPIPDTSRPEYNEYT